MMRRIARLLSRCCTGASATLLLGASLQGCSSEADVRPEEALDGIQGELVIRVADYENKSTSIHYSLRDEQEQEYELIFEQEPELEPGSHVVVDGVIEQDDVTPRIRVQSLQILSGPEAALGEAQQPLLNNAARPDYTVAVLLVNWGSPDQETIESMRAKVFTNANSTSEYYKETSYGLQKLSGDVFGWFSIPNPGSCAADVIATSARNAATAAGVNLGNYKQIMYYFPRYSACGWAGLAQIGSPGKPARDSWYAGYSDCVVLGQELAHNWGLLHSRSCKNQPASGLCPAADIQEYGDRFCPMGGGCWQMNTVQKAEMNWFGACNVVAAKAGGTFDIAPYETASNGIQALRVPKGDGRYFYIENRRALGKFDTMRSSATINTVFTGVLIHEGPEQLSPQPSMATRNPYLIDTNPGTSTFDDAALQVGKTWSNGNVTITLVSKDANGVAKVQVTVAGGTGDALCLDGTKFGAVTQPPDEPPQPPQNIPNTLTAKNSGKCLDVYANGNGDGTNIQQWTCHTGGAQAFKLEPIAGGAFRILHIGSGKCVDVSGASTATGANIQLWTCNGTGAQSFRVEDSGGGYSRIVNTNSNKCMEVADASTANDANVRQWDCNGGDNQQWKIATPACGGITLYQHINYGGYAVTLPAGDYNTAALASRGVVNNDVTSLKVPAGCSVKLFDGDNYTGITLDKTADDASLVDDARSGGSWNDLMSSIQVR
jgi:hypothetical protein